MPDWSLDIAGTRKSPADWGLARGLVRYQNLAADELSFLRDGSLFDADPLCAWGAAVKLYDTAGVKIFEGTCQNVPAQATGNAESQSYQFAGPWRFLEQNLFKQLWKGAIGGVLTQIYVSHLILNTNGTSIITSVLTYAIASGAPFQIGTIDIPVFPPYTEIVDRTCATVILDVLKYAPDAAGWFDYSTSPPTFHCKQRSKRNGADVLALNLAAVTLSLPPAAAQTDLKITALSPITPRVDLQIPSVELIYEIINTVDGVEKWGFYREVYPAGATGREDACLSSTINLQGFSATHVRGTIQAETIDTNSLEWWKKILPQLADPRVIPYLKFSGGSAAASLQRLGTDGLPSLGFGRRMLPEGSGAADWMINPDGSSLDWNEELFQIKFDLGINDEDGQPSIFQKNILFTATVMTTNAPNGETEYSALETFETGDPVPVGLAKFLYDSFSTLHYDCAVELTEAECSSAIKLGNLLNIAGSRAEYAAMNALVQDITLSLDDGRTAITAGPPRQLALNDVLELLRANRSRRRWTNPDTQNTGDLSGPSNVQLGRATASTNSIPGLGVSTYFAVKTSPNKIALDTRAVDAATGAGFKIFMDAGGAQKLNIDFASADWLAASTLQKEIKVKLVEVCVNNVTKHMLVLGSDAF